MAKARIVVVGAGVTGLTTALELSRTTKYDITVAAKYMPGDYDAESYASPWAGANYLPISQAGTASVELDRNTWPELEKLARLNPEAGIHFVDTLLYNRKKDLSGPLGSWTGELMKPEPWFKDVVPDFRALTSEELRGYDYGTTFTSVCINTAIYLPWLVSQCLKAGVVFKRSVFNHIVDAAEIHHSGRKADLIVNCTGISSLNLGGVEDKEMLPARAQIVLVRNESPIMVSTSGTGDGDDEVCYIMQRAAGGGTILGGCYQKGNWDTQVDYNLANRIMKRCVDICPALTGGQGIEHLNVIRHSVGLRPVRKSGVRIEKEQIKGIWTVHNYGHGGFGYQTSYGCSQVAVKLVEQALASSN